MPDVDAWHDDITGRGLEPTGPPFNQAWGNREVTFHDPFGNRVTLGTRLKSGD